MGTDIDEIAIGLARALEEKNQNLEDHIQAHIERSLGRALLKVGLLGAISACLTVGGVVVSVTHYVDKIDRTIELQQKQIDHVESNVNHHDARIASVEQTAIHAQAAADIAIASIQGHIAGQTEKKR